MKKGIAISILMICTLMFTGCSANSSVQKAEKYKSTVTAYADAVYYRTYNELCSACDTIFYGKVNNVETTANPDIDPKMLGVQDVTSHYEVQVIDCVKGNQKADDRIKVFQLGGVYENVNYVIDDGESFETGKEYMFFVNKKEDGTYVEVTPYQGHISITDGHCALSEKMVWDEMEYLICDQTSYEELTGFLKKYI